MGQIGRYLDALPERALDRVIVARDWCMEQTVGDDGYSRCLVGHAGDAYKCRGEGGSAIDMFADIVFGLAHGKTARHFDRLAGRVGLERAVQLVKARAGKRTRLPLTEAANVAAPTREAQLIG